MKQVCENKQKPRLFIHAANIHQGGGKSLLLEVIKSLSITEPVVLILDSRLQLPDLVFQTMTIKLVEPSIQQRVKVEFWLKRNVWPQDVVLCFGNLPPLFHLRGRTTVFMQNRYLIDNVRLTEFLVWPRLRLALERLWLLFSGSNADRFVVQTPSMNDLMKKKTGGKASVSTLPFVGDFFDFPRSISRPWHAGNKFDFCYVASGEPHKNHKVLLQAWVLLANEGIFPSLCLTLCEMENMLLVNEIDALTCLHGIRVLNIGYVPHSGISSVYKNAGALIYPSILESFGLPLVEARRAGLPILASELDYVRDVLDPEQSFDPRSAKSISKAVKRFMGIEDDVLELLSARDFIKQIVDSD